MVLTCSYHQIFGRFRFQFSPHPILWGSPSDHTSTEPIIITYHCYPGTYHTNFNDINPAARVLRFGIFRDQHRSTSINIDQQLSTTYIKGFYSSFPQRKLRKRSLKGMSRQAPSPLGQPGQETKNQADVIWEWIKLDYQMCVCIYIYMLVRLYNHCYYYDLYC